MLYNLTSLRHSNFSYFAKMDRLDTIRFLKKCKLEACFASCNLDSKDIILFGNSDKISEIIESLNHELLHIYGSLPIMDDVNLNKYDQEYMVHSLTDKRISKRLSRMNKFVRQLYTKG